MDVLECGHAVMADNSVPAPKLGLRECGFCRKTQQQEAANRKAKLTGRPAKLLSKLLADIGADGIMELLAQKEQARHRKLANLEKARAAMAEKRKAA